MLQPCRAAAAVMRAAAAAPWSNKNLQHGFCRSLETKIGSSGGFLADVEQIKAFNKMPIIMEDPCELKCTIQAQTRVTSYLFYAVPR